MKEKWKNFRGESLGETMIAFLLSSLALLMLASLILWAGKTMEGAGTGRTVFYQAGNTLESGGGTIRSGKLILQGAEVSVRELEISIFLEEQKGLWRYEAKTP